MARMVSNATHLIYLAKIGKLYLIKSVFKEVAIPEEVRREVVDRGKARGEKDAYIIEKAINAGWIKVYEIEKLELPIKLDAGETAALSLAKKLHKDVLIDEISARTAAEIIGLTPRGTVFVLLKALEMKELNFEEFLETLARLIQEGFRLREDVYIEAVEIAEKIQRDKK
ncbi:MAG: hypothetical protein V3T58_04775 [Candidatus Hydrothermarchaeales archaeon]